MTFFFLQVQTGDALDVYGLLHPMTPAWRAKNRCRQNLNLGALSGALAECVFNKRSMVFANPALAGTLTSV